MTMRSRPNRQRGERRDEFVNQAAADNVSTLHCKIPASLHRELRIIAAQEDTNVTILVINAIKKYLAERQ